MTLSSVALVLEDEPDVSGRSGKGHGAERARRLKAGGAVGNGHVRPVLDGALRGHVAAGDKAELGRGAVHVETWWKEGAKVVFAFRLVL